MDNSIALWAESQPIWMQVVIGLAVFFVILPVAITTAYLLLYAVFQLFRTPEATHQEIIDAKQMEVERKVRAKKEGITPMHMVLIGLPCLFLALALFVIFLAETLCL